MTLFWVAGITFKSTMVAAIALAGNYALKRQPAALRTTLLQASLVGLLLLPICASLLPEIDLAWLPRGQQFNGRPPLVPVADMAGSRAGEANATFDLLSFALLSYWAGAAILLTDLCIGIWTLRRWTHRASSALSAPWQEGFARWADARRNPVRLRLSRDVKHALSWGARPGVILIDEITHGHVHEVDAVLAHEMAHLRRLDWIGLICARIVRIVFWFNPMVWLLVRELERQSELAADAEALRHIDRATYAQVLLNKARDVSHCYANGMVAPRGEIARRIAAALDSTKPNGASSIVHASLSIVMLAFIAMLAPARLMATPQLEDKLDRINLASPIAGDVRRPVRLGRSEATILTPDASALSDDRSVKAIAHPVSTDPTGAAASIPAVEIPPVKSSSDRSVRTQMMLRNAAQLRESAASLDAAGPGEPPGVVETHRSTAANLRRAASKMEEGAARLAG